MRGANSQHWTAALNYFALQFPGRLPDELMELQHVDHQILPRFRAARR